MYSLALLHSACYLRFAIRTCYLPAHSADCLRGYLYILPLPSFTVVYVVVVLPVVTRLELCADANVALTLLPAFPFTPLPLLFTEFRRSGRYHFVPYVDIYRYRSRSTYDMPYVVCPYLLPVTRYRCSLRPIPTVPCSGLVVTLFCNSLRCIAILTRLPWPIPLYSDFICHYCCRLFDDVVTFTMPDLPVTCYRCWLILFLYVTVTYYGWLRLFTYTVLFCWFLVGLYRLPADAALPILRLFTSFCADSNVLPHHYLHSVATVYRVLVTHLRYIYPYAFTNAALFPTVACLTWFWLRLLPVRHYAWLHGSVRTRYTITHTRYTPHTALHTHTRYLLCTYVTRLPHAPYAHAVPALPVLFTGSTTGLVCSPICFAFTFACRYRLLGQLLHYTPGRFFCIPIERCILTFDLPVTAQRLLPSTCSCTAHYTHFPGSTAYRACPLHDTFPAWLLPYGSFLLHYVTAVGRVTPAFCYTRTHAVTHLVSKLLHIRTDALPTFLVGYCACGWLALPCHISAVLFTMDYRGLYSRSVMPDR